MTHYRVCTSPTPEGLSAVVERLLAAGWWAQGGVSVTLAPTGYASMMVERHYAQAMMLTKYDSSKIEEKQTAEATV